MTVDVDGNPDVFSDFRFWWQGELVFRCSIPTAIPIGCLAFDCDEDSICLFVSFRFRPQGEFGFPILGFVCNSTLFSDIRVVAITPIGFLFSSQKRIKIPFCALSIVMATRITSPTFDFDGGSKGFPDVRLPCRFKFVFRCSMLVAIPLGFPIVDIGDSSNRSPTFDVGYNQKLLSEVRCRWQFQLVLSLSIPMIIVTDLEHVDFIGIRYRMSDFRAWCQF